MIDYKPAA